MRSNVKLQSLYATYYLIVFSTVLGMLYKFYPTGVTRRIYLACKLLLLACLIAYLFLDFLAKHKVHKDSIFLGAFVIYELFISKARGLLIFPNAYIDILTWPLVYIFFRNYTRRSALPHKIGKMTQRAMVLIFILSIPLIIKHRKGDGDVGGTVFFVYYCITFLPIALYSIDDYKVTNRVFIISIIILMISTKRSGTIVAIVGYVIHLFNDVRVRDDIRSKISKYQKYIVCLVASVILFVILDKIFTLEIYSRLKSITTDQGSGRIYIWSNVLKAFKGSEWEMKLFGHGYQAVYYRLKPFGVDRLAHNSFLELLYDYGYIGLSIFIVYFLSLVGKAVQAYKIKDSKTPAMLYTLLICIVFGMTSYLFEESTIIVPIAIFWGCFVGENYRKREIQNHLINQNEERTKR